MLRLVVGIILVAFVATPVVADDTRKREVAHAKQAQTFMDKAQYDQAIVEYQAAYDLGRKPQHLYNIATAYNAKGDKKSAIEFFRKYLEAQPDAPKAAQIREYIATVTKELADAEEARKKVEAERLAAAEREQKRLAILEAEQKARGFEQAGQWVAAAEAHLHVFSLDNNPGHLISAGNAYRNIPDLAKAREQYQRYVDAVPSGPQTDATRTAIAELTKELDRAAQAERDRALAATIKKPAESDKKPKPSRISKKWILVGGALIIGGLVADLVPASGDNGKLDVSDFAGPVLYGAGAAGILIGVF